MPKHMKKYLLCIFLLHSMVMIGAPDPQTLISQANKAYASENYTNAIELYKQVLDQGFEASELYYNIGNAFYKLNQLPSAILYYEKARKLNPGSEDIDFNLKVVNNKISDKIEPLPELFYIRWINSVIRLFSFDEWAKISIVFFIISMFMIAVYYASKILIIRKTGFYIAIVAFTFSVLVLLISISSYQQYISQHEAIVFSPTITVKSSPDEKSIDLFVVHEGTKVKIIDKIGQWLEIRIPNGSVGWLPSSSVERI
jgi:tetratricopeptide (TPR) repeat protein